MLSVLILMLLDHGVHGDCPPGLNPLVLDPPQVVAEYGQPVEVNCTSTYPGPLTMYWSTGNQSPERSDRGFVTWKVDNVSDWDEPPQCKIELNRTHECSKDLPITLYKNPESVILRPVSHGDGWGEGAELQCDVVNVVPAYNLTVVWFSGNDSVSSDSFEKREKTPVNETSMLNSSLSRLYPRAQFRCEAQLDLGPERLPAITTQTQRIPAHYLPRVLQCPSAFTAVEQNFSLSMLPCRADGSPQASVEWYHQGSLMDPTVPLTRMDSGVYEFKATNAYGITITAVALTVEWSRAKQFHGNVNVTSTAQPMTAPEATPTQACPLELKPKSVLVRHGARLDINCTTSADGYVILEWETSVGRRERGKNFVTLIVEQLKSWKQNAFCFITAVDGSQCKVFPGVSVYKPPTTMSISLVNHTGPLMEGAGYQLSCQVLDVGPVRRLTLYWYRGNEIISERSFEEETMYYGDVSFPLSLIPRREDHHANYRCEARLSLRSETGECLNPAASTDNYTAIVHYAPLMLDCPPSYVGVEHNFTLSMVPCHADGNPPPTLYWQHQEINITDPNFQLTRNASGTYKAFATNEAGEASAEFEIVVEYGPSYACEDFYEVREGDELGARCKPDGNPEPLVAWFKDGEAASSPKTLTRRDGGNHTLEATNKHGTAAHKLRVDILYGPEFKRGNDTLEVPRGADVLLECSAQGNPPPLVRWSYSPAANAEQTARGCQSSVRVTGATSANAATYACVATNKVGNVTRSTTVVLEDHSIAIVNVVSAMVLVTVTLFLVVPLIICLCRHYRRNRGQYNLVQQNFPMSNNMQRTY